MLDWLRGRLVSNRTPKTMACTENTNMIVVKIGFGELIRSLS